MAGARLDEPSVPAFASTVVRLIIGIHQAVSDPRRGGGVHSQDSYCLSIQRAIQHTMRSFVRKARGRRVLFTLSGNNTLGMSVTNGEKSARSAKGRRRWRIIAYLFCGAGLVWGGWAWWTDHRYKSAMEEIEAEIL